MKRTIVIAVVVLTVVAVLAGGAFVGTRMLQQQNAAPAVADDDIPQELLEDLPAEALQGGGVLFAPEPAKDLPQTEPAAFGLVARMEDNSLFVGTGNVMTSVELDDNGNVTGLDSQSDGPELEVVVKRDTVIYRDDTDMAGLPGPEAMTQGSDKEQVFRPQQVVTQVDSIDEIEKQSMIVVWGERKGDRLIAEVISFTPPGAMGF